MRKQEYLYYQKLTQSLLEDAGIILTEKEKREIEVADFGLDDIKSIGLQIVTYINTDRVCAKELVMLPYQTCPEHMHPQIGDNLGKEETFRCRKGKVYLYVEGEPTKNINAIKPETDITVWHEIILSEGEQYTIYPNTLHWFQAGPEGAIISEFSTKSTDELDVFTDQGILRKPIIEK